MAKLKSHHWIVVLLMASGVALCAMVLAFEAVTLNRYERQVDLSSLMNQAALQVAELHLWFEEAVSDDAFVDIDKDVRIPLKEVVAEVTKTAHEQEPGSLRNSLLELRDQLTELEVALEARWAAGEQAGTGADEAFDLIYRGCLTRFSSIRDISQKKTRGERGRLESLINLAVVLVILLFAFLSYLVHQNRRAAELRTQELEFRVQERTGELVAVNRDLVLAKDRAEEASRAKTQFLANMSHEIRTPLNAVIGTVSLLLRTRVPSDQRQSLLTIQSSGRALLGMLSDVLDFSRVEVGSVELEAQEFDVVEVVENVLLLFTEQASQKGLELVFDRQTLLPRGVIGDGGRLRQILVNLVSNAVKFTHAGEITVSCAARRRCDSRVELRFQVEDTGIGIPTARRATLFDPFTQADSSHTRVYGGTGLGLAICKELISLMQGELSLSSEPGCGTRFAFAVELDLTVFDETVVELSSGRALLCDDNPRARVALTQDLQRLGYEVVAVEDIGSFAEAWEQQAFDRVLVDVGVLCEDQGVTFDPSLLAPLQTLILFRVGNAYDASCVQQFSGCTRLAKPVTERQLIHALRSVETGETFDGVEAPEDLPGGRQLRVLVAEDNPINQNLVTAMLERVGCIAEIVANGVDALAAVKHRDFDLVLMDCQMPELDGYETTARIRELGGRGRLPIIALTAHAMRGDRERALAAGMDDYLAKPFEIDDLQLMLGRWGTRLVAASHGQESAGAGESSARADVIAAAADDNDDSTGSSAPPAELEVETGMPEGSALGSVALDPAPLHRLRESGGDGFVRELVTIFLEETPQSLETLKAAGTRSDTEQVRAIAHRLRSSCANLGARQLADNLKDIELTFADDAISAALIARCQEEFERVRAALDRLRSESIPAQEGRNRNGNQRSES